MGKIKAKRSKHRVNPTGVPTMAELEAEVTTQPQTQAPALHPLVEQLVNTDPHEREFACGALANIVLDESTSPTALATLFQQGMLHRLLTCLKDDVPAVAAEAAGCLRNLALHGGHNALLSMVEAGVVTTLMQMLAREMGLMGSSTSEDTAQRRRGEMAVNCVDNAINLTWLLCEESGKAMDQALSLDLLPLLLQLLDPTTIPRNVALAAAQCMYTVSDDNPTVSQTLNQGTLLGALQASVGHATQPDDAQGLLLRLVHAGILLNIVGALDGDLSVAVISALRQALAADSVALLTDTLPCLADIRVNDEALHIKSDAQKAAEERVETTRTMLSAQQLALELLTNVAAVTEEEEWEEVEGDSENQSMDTDEPQADLPDSRQPPSWAAPLAAAGIPSLVLSCCKCAPPHVYQVLGSAVHGQMLLDGINAVQERALTAANNLLMADEIPGMQLVSVEECWNALSPILLAPKTAGMSSELSSALTTALWTLLRRVAATPQLAANFTPSPQVLQQLAQMAEGDEPTRVNVAGLLGTLSAIPSLVAARTDMLQLLCRLVDDTSLAVCAEALHSIFDAYAEGDVTDACTQCQLVDRLQSVHQKLKKRLGKERKTLAGGVAGRLDDALYNLPRFVAYRQSL